MKKCLFALCITTVLLSGCKQEQKEPEPAKEAPELQAKGDDLSLLRGEFIYIDDAAVLKGNDFIYGVVIDSMAKKLSEEVAPLKREDYDMVPVIVKGKVKPNPAEEGWKEVVEVKEILRVSKPVSEPAIKVKGEQKS